MDDFLRDAFYEEADELFEEIEKHLLEIESSGASRDRIDALFRYMHTLKGSSSAMGLMDMAKLTHHLEDYMGLIREGKRDFTLETANLMLESLDELKLRIGRHKQDEPYEIDLARFIENGGEKGKDNSGEKALRLAISDDDRINIKGALKEGETVHLVEITLRRDCRLKGARLLIITNTLGEGGRVCKTGWDNLAPESVDGDRFEILYITQMAADELKLWVNSLTDVEEVRIRDIDLEVRSKSAKEPQAATQPVIRVSISKLDNLLKTVEQMSVAKERLKKLTLKLISKFDAPDDDRDIAAFSALVDDIDKIGNEMQDLVLSTRMHSLQQVFQRFPRMVRDLSLKQGKRIEFIMEGESTELDRSIVEKIVDPLTHILRNSVDHGIEAPEIRARLGKPEKGTIRLSAGQEEGFAYIRIEDDGRGISPEAVRRSALRKGLLSEEQLEKLSDAEVPELIFMPGFSTAETISDISGRGVGMNVVKENIEQANGIIEIDNREGQGLTITLKLPLTLAIIDSLLIKAGHHKFAVPLLSIQEIIRIRESDAGRLIRHGQGNEVVVWREEEIPLARVSGIFNIREEGASGDFVGLMAGVSGKRIIFKVDELLEQQQIVIKPLDKYIGRDRIMGDLKGITGAAILGDGDIAFILDLQDLAKTIGQ